MKFTPEDIDVLARTVWGEARGEPRAGQVAVAHVILNRASQGGWWGDTVAKVCLHKYQFSAWLENDPNRAKMEALTGEETTFRQCLSIAAGVLGGIHADPTGGANHYHTKKVKPDWATAEPIADIGAHLFYALS